MTLFANPHRRFNPLLREWVLVSPHRTDRPWQGQVERAPRRAPPAYDPTCYLCPGNARAGGVRNPSYTGTFVFDNDFAALRPDTPEGGINDDGLIVATSEPGICRVVCFSPRHDLTLATMPAADVRAVVDTWVVEYLSLGSRPGISYVEIFENRGEMMGASNPHPHGQIWATHTIPDLPARELASAAAYRQANDCCLLCDYTALERHRGERIVSENEAFVAVVPFWAVWPFELLILSIRHLGSIDQLTPAERDALADILRRVTTRYDNLFEAPFPYSMGFHQHSTNGSTRDDCHLHVHFYPPLLRSATIRKFMVGFELLGMPQRDITPESAAERLRAVGDEHYLLRAR